MRCAAAKADITPAPGVEMSGYVARRQPSTGVHDPLFAYALYLEDEGARLLWLHADVVAFEGADVRRLKAALSGRFGLAAHEVMVTATHTHSGPAVVRLSRCGAYDPGTVERILETFGALAEEAIARPEPVEVIFGEGSLELGIHRRPSERPHTDPRLPALAFRRADGTVAAVLALYAMHNVAMGGENTLISADMAGQAARSLSAALPGFPPVLWLNGACGDINPPSVQKDFECMEGWGDAMAAAAQAALESAVPVPDATLRSALASLTLAPEPISPERADAMVAEQKRRAGPPTAGPNAWAIEACHAAADDWRALATSDDPEVRERRAVTVDVQAVRLGPAVWVGIAGEPFSILNDLLREATGEDVYVVGYANGDGGYLCPEHVYDEGGYEPYGAFIFYGTNPIPRGAFERVQNTAQDLIRQVIDEERL